MTVVTNLFLPMSLTCLTEVNLILPYGREVGDIGARGTDGLAIARHLAIEGKNIKGRNDIGNGRLARNMVEKAILNQSKRLSEEKETDHELLKLSDFELEEMVAEIDNYKTMLSSIGFDIEKNSKLPKKKVKIEKIKKKK